MYVYLYVGSCKAGENIGACFSKYIYIYNHLTNEQEQLFASLLLIDFIGLTMNRL